jgi:signal transduction histidine kinase
MKIDWVDKLRMVLQTLAFGLAVASIQFAFRPHIPYVVPLVYSLCISTFTWAMIDFGRHLFASSAQTGWPQGGAGMALALVGNVGGYTLGTLAGDSWFGWSSWDGSDMQQLRISLMITALASLAITYFFYTQNKRGYLESRMSEAEHQAAEARLKLLETQLEPHMLFNTLANLRALVASDPPRAVVMLDHLIAYLRSTLNASRASLHPLQTEFDRLRDYLELMAIRMGPRLQFTLDLPPELATLMVPPLLLQPLVENSIKHGLEPKVQGGSIKVQARQKGDWLTLEVSDTGAGPGAGVEGGSGFGLAQVRERLSTAYGPQATKNMIAAPACGTGVLITIPSKNGPK